MLVNASAHRNARTACDICVRLAYIYHAQPLNIIIIPRSHHHHSITHIWSHHGHLPPVFCYASACATSLIIRCKKALCWKVCASNLWTLSIIAEVFVQRWAHAQSVKMKVVLFHSNNTPRFLWGQHNVFTSAENVYYVFDFIVSRIWLVHDNILITHSEARYRQGFCCQKIYC